MERGESRTEKYFYAALQGNLFKYYGGEIIRDGVKNAIIGSFVLGVSINRGIEKSSKKLV